MSKKEVVQRKKILIIGGAGFIGSYLTNEFIKKGHQVFIIDPLYNYSGIEKLFFEKIINFRKKYLLKGAKLFFEDYLDSGSKIISDIKPDVVINLAAISIEGSKDETIAKKQLVDTTILTESIVSDVRKNNVNRYIFQSSIFAYGDIDDWSVTEKNKLHPRTPYGISKAIGELITKAYLENWNIVRTTSVYGFGDSNLRVAQIFVNKALKKEPFWVNKGALLDFTYVKDLVRGIYQVAMSNFIKEDFHLTGGKAVLLPEFVSELKKHWPKLKFEVKDESADRPQRGTMDITKARIMLGWSPEYDLRRGIKEYAKLAKKFGHG